ncbi:MAG TPA: SOS response-associated peptidase [Burkholderiales bacterium]|nr:SOS response-associated peptidase [Burkholderiales bacterium]
MCGRFALHARPEGLALQFGLAAAPALAPRYNVCPGTDVLAVRAGASGERRAVALRWGLIPRWAKDPAIGQKLANARGESLAERPAFRDAFRARRCLVPASGYYERQAAGRARQPWYLHPRDGALFGLAGIAATWHGPRGPLRTLALITTAPNELAARIHDRMPLVIAPADYGAWLDPANGDLAALKALVRPYPAERMAAHRVSRRVNGPESDDAALIAPLAEGPAQGELL